MPALADRLYLVRQDLEAHAGQNKRPAEARSAGPSPGGIRTGRKRRARQKQPLLSWAGVVSSAAVTIGDLPVDGDRATRTRRFRESREIS